jgi:hypothetical protein
MITYENIIEVRLDGKVVGQIRPVNTGGYQYIPKGQKTRGEVFQSIAEVKASLI